jgi:hypothetical protein
MTTNDLDLVREYALHKSESAFAALVSRHSKRIRWPSAFVLAGDTIAEDFPPDDADKDDFNHNCVGGADNGVPAEGWQVHGRGQNILFEDGHVKCHKGYATNEMTFRYELIHGWE